MTRFIPPHATRRRFAATRLAFALLAALAFVLAASSETAYGKTIARDHLTPQEVDLVRDEQRLDRRTDLFIKAVDRRLSLLAGGREKPGDAEKFGALDGTPAELLSDIARIFDEAAVNIDDASERKRQQEVLAKSLRKLADAASRALRQIAPLRDTADEPTRRALEAAVENAEEIVEAAGRLPAPEKSDGKSNG